MNRLAVQIIPLLFFAADAFAEVEGSKASQNPLSVFMPIILLFVIFYFLLIRPQQKKSKEHKAMLSVLKKGDSVLTSGGVFGKITGVAENSYTVEVAKNIEIKVAKSYIVEKK